MFFRKKVRIHDHSTLYRRVLILGDNFQVKSFHINKEKYGHALILMGDPLTLPDSIHNNSIKYDR